MKKSLKKLSLNKKAVSNLTLKIMGGKKHETTNITANTGCYDCPPR